MKVSPDSEVVLQVPNGPTVTVPIGAVDADGTLVAELREDAPALAEGMAVVPVWDIHLDDAVLTGDLTITMPYEVGPDTLVGALAYFDAATDQWTPVAANVDEGAHTMSASVRHLSLWSVFAWSVNSLKGWFEDTLRDTFGPPDVDQPVCEGEAAFRKSVSVTSDDGDRVRWCAGVESGQEVLRLTNARSYSVEVRLPEGWTVVDLRPALGIIDSFAQGLADAGLFSDQRMIVAPGQTLTIVAPQGTGGTAVVHPSGGAYILDALAFGFKTLAMVTAKVPGGPAVDASKTSDVLHGALETTECVDNLRAFVVDDAPESAGEVKDLMLTVFGISFGCLGKAWGANYGVGGVIATLVVGFVTWVISGVETLVNGVKGFWDQVTDLDGYQIDLQVIAKPDVDPVTGAWLISGKGVGPVKLGASLAGLDTKYGDGGKEPVCDLWPLYSESRRFIVFPEGSQDPTVASFGLWDDHSGGPALASTAEGVTFGSSLEQVVAAYPTAVVTRDVLNVGYEGAPTAVLYVTWVDEGTPMVADLDSDSERVTEFWVNFDHYPNFFCE